MTNNLHSLLYVTPNKLFWYGEHFSSLQQLILSQESMSDLEIMNQDKFSSLLEEFFLKHKSKEEEVTIILSTDMTFDQEFVDDNALKDGLTVFLDRVPFEKVTHRVYYVNKKIKAVAANKEYCMMLRRILIETRCIPTACIPFSILQDVFPEFRSGIDLRILLTKADIMKQYNLFVEEDASQQITRVAQQTIEKNRMSMLIGVLVLLLIILAIVIVFTFR